MKVAILTDLLQFVVDLEGDESDPMERITDHLREIEGELRWPGADMDQIRSEWLAIAATAIHAAEKAAS